MYSLCSSLLIVFGQRELVLKAKEIFVTYGPWLVNGSLDKLKVIMLALMTKLMAKIGTLSIHVHSC